MRIAIFGGSFDPTHNEHVHFAETAVSALGLDKLFVMPAHAPPQKKGKILSSDYHRLQMCRLAFENTPRVEVSDYEIAQGGYSYTYLTCQYFRRCYPMAEIFWLVGTDMLRDFPTWKNPKEILSCVTLAVCGRNEAEGWVKKEQEDFVGKFGKEFVYVPYNGLDVSSTKIRVLAGAGMRLNKYLPEKVEAYICENGLYKIENADKALALEKESRSAHSIRVAELAAARSLKLGISEKQAITAALFHDCAKNLPSDSPLLQGFSLQEEWGDVPSSVYHQYAGAYVAEKYFSVQDEEILDAIRYHTSGREDMGKLEQLIFLADMLEEERNYGGVEILRELFWKGDSLEVCLTETLRQTLEFLKEKKAEIYPLTQKAYEFYEKKNKKR